ncbi:MAG: zinc ribbon domain-containing protein [Clostridia bacterium]|nr:zinc ribbon domain-containing protein [Clostridia bacterium]
MQCPNCRHENKDDATFCEKCGAQLVSEKKKMSFFERRQAKERERLYILSKSSLQEEDVKDIKDLDMGEIETVVKGKKAQIKKSTAIGLALSIIGVIIGIVAIYIVGRLKFNNTLRVTVILALFLLCFTAGAFSIDYGYRMRIINAMCKSNFAIKKISYGKPPVMLLDDTFYDLKIKSKCDIAGCGATMHIEEYNGEFIAVCDADRSHLRRLDCSVLNKNSAKDCDNLDK